HQKGRQIFLVTPDQVTSQAEEQFAFGLACGGKSKVCRDVFQKLLRAQTRVEYVRIRNSGLIQQCKKAADQQGLPSADLARPDNEALTPAHAIVKRGQGLVVFPGGEKKRRIGRDLEWVPRQMVEALIH